MRSAEPVRGSADARVGARELWRLALPALPVLAAEPLYLMVDALVVGRLGQRPLAALGAGSLVLLVLGTQMNFLSYGTTARSARLHGAGQEDEAVAEGVDASWIALGVGLPAVAVVLAATGPITGALTPDAETAAETARWLRIAVWGIPLILLSAAGNGWLRGVQRTREPLLFVVGGVAVSTLGCIVLVPGLGPAPALGLAGSAVANLVGQALAATGFVVALARAHRGPATPRPAVIRRQLRLGGDLVVRTAAFQVSFTLATSTAAAAGAATLAAHHLAGQVWSLYSLVLDSVAIAAQSLVGAALGAGSVLRARAVGASVLRSTLVLGVVLAALTWLGGDALASLLTPDAEVAERVATALRVMAAMVVPAALVFGLDGVLLGAGDAAYLRTTTALTAVVGFVPVLLATRALGWGIVGIWSGLALFLVLRLLAVGHRYRGDCWARTDTRTDTCTDTRTDTCTDTSRTEEAP